MTTTMTDELTRPEERKLARLAKDLRDQAAAARLGGLDERAEVLDAEADTVAERVQAATKRRRERKLAQRAERKAAEDRHEAALKRREAEAERRAEAMEWLKSAIARFGGQPQPADTLLQMARAAGHEADDIEAISVKVRRRGRGSDDTAYLGLPGRFLKRDWLEV